MAGTDVLALWTGQAEGDLRDLGGGRPPPPGAPADRPVLRLHQVHGDGVVVVGTPGLRADRPRNARAVRAEETGPPVGDVLVARGDGATLAVLTADCASVALGSHADVFAAVHVGWRGLVAGVVDRALDVMRHVGALDIVAGLGPCIGPCCYEFSPAHAASLVQQLGTDVTALSARGRLSLDLPGAVRARLEANGVPLAVSSESCTACSPGYFSHRARRDEARQALLVWRAV